LQYILLLEVIVQVLHYRNSEGLSMWWGYCIINRANNDHKPSLMNLVFVIMLCPYHSQCFLLANESIAHLVLWLMETICVWWKTLCGMEHVKYVQYDIGWSRLTNWNFKNSIWKIKSMGSYRNESMDMHENV